MNDSVRSASPCWNRSIIGAVVLGVALRLLLIVMLPQSPFSDGAWYVDRANEIAAGLGYQEGGHPTAFWPAGYPLMLAAMMRVSGPGLQGALLLNLVAAGVLIWLVGWFGRRVGGSERVGHIAAFAYALYPAHIAYTGAPMPETVSTAIVAGASAVMLVARGRAWRLLIAGLLFGLATLVRAQLMYFPAGLAVALALLPRGGTVRSATLAAVVVYGAMAVTIAPLTLRNHAVFGQWVLVSTNGGVALRTGAADDATGDHLDWNAARWNAEGIPFDQRVARQVEADRILRARAKDWIVAHPGRWLALMPVKAATLWAKDTDAFWGLRLTYPRFETPLQIVSALNQLVYWAVLLLSLPALHAGLTSLFRCDPGRRELLFLFLMPAFVTLTAVLFTGQIRYHYPAMPFLFVAAAWTFVRLRERMTARGAVAT